jgi:hypothetical protein
MSVKFKLGVRRRIEYVDWIEMPSNFCVALLKYKNSGGVVAGLVLLMLRDEGGSLGVVVRMTGVVLRSSLRLRLLFSIDVVCATGLVVLNIFGEMCSVF